jgi:hypothetical protein
MKPRNVVSSIGAVGVVLCALVAAPNVQAGQRPIEDFLKAQGTYIDPTWPWHEEWTLFYGCNSPDVPYGFAIDYAGVASRWLQEQYGVSVGTTFNGFVNERALPDGTTEVTVVLQTRDALAWVLATPGDPLQQEVLFGYLPPDVATGSPVALGDCTLQVKFINNAPPGSPLPDLESPDAAQQMRFIAIAAQAHGPLRAAFGVPEGTPGFVQTRETGLLATAGKANPKSRVALDAFPAEKIIIKPVGR